MPILAALLFSAALTADATPDTPVPDTRPVTVEAKDPNKTICRKGVNQTGSRMRQRPICMTRREWSDREREDKQLMDAVQRGSSANTRKPGTPQ